MMKVTRFMLAAALAVGVAGSAGAAEAQVWRQAPQQRVWQQNQQQHDRDRDRDRDRDGDRDDRSRDGNTRYGQNGQYGQYGPNGAYNQRALQQAQRIGYQDGLNEGSKDGQTGHSFRPTNSSNYKHANRGISSGIDRGSYSAAYRQAYEQGYQRGYGQYRQQGPYGSRWPY